MSNKRFGTFDGVFTPTLLSILGVVMYLRLGWVVGQVGLKSALAIIIVSNLITLFTGLSAASITTNIRIGTGGAYSIISKSLGYEVGGSIGVPLYFSQAISVAFYITGFTECWVSVFPQHEFIFVSIITWIALLLIAYTSAKLAFRLQYGIIAIIALSLVSAFLAKSRLESSTLFLQGVAEVPFWQVFAIFFPAVTGILAGISMSGELKDPEHNIPVGTLSAIGIGFLTYLAMAVWFAHIATPRELVSNTSVIIEVSRWRSLIVAGIMGATLSSALSMLVASPRTLLALAKHRIVPLSYSFNRINKRGEPTAAILFTAFVSLLTIVMGTLNNIASVLTMFFLITYGMLNIAVFIEKGIGIVSFRPVFKVPLLISFLGGAGCVYAMFLINPLFSIIAIAVTIFIYLFLLRRESPKKWPDVRRGLFIFIAERAVKIASGLPYHPKIWKPNLLVPVEKPDDWSAIMEAIRSICYPRGRIEFLTIVQKLKDDKENFDTEKTLELKRRVTGDLVFLGKPLEEDGMFVSNSVIDSGSFLDGMDIAMQTLKSSVLPPNVLFIKLGLDPQRDYVVKGLMERAEPYDFGIMLFRYHPKIGLGNKSLINLWVRSGSPNIDLAVLVALQLEKNWEANLRLLQVVSNENERQEAEIYLSKLKKIMRLPKNTEILVFVGNFEEIASAAPSADINIFGMPGNREVSLIRKISDKVNTSVLFLRDSKQESAIV